MLSVGCYIRVVLKYLQLVTLRERLLRACLATKLPRPGDMVHKFNVFVKCCEHIKQHVCYSLLDAGESLLPVNHRQRVDTDGMLSVSAINRLSDAGWYTCDARDSTGQGMSRSVYVSVMGSSSLFHLVTALMCTYRSGFLRTNTIKCCRQTQPLETQMSQRGLRVYPGIVC